MHQHRSGVTVREAIQQENLLEQQTEARQTEQSLGISQKASRHCCGTFKSHSACQHDVVTMEGTNNGFVSVVEQVVCVHASLPPLSLVVAKHPDHPVRNGASPEALRAENQIATSKL